MKKIPHCLRQYILSFVYKKRRNRCSAITAQNRKCKRKCAGILCTQHDRMFSIP